MTDVILFKTGIENCGFWNTKLTRVNFSEAKCIGENHWDRAIFEETIMPDGSFEPVAKTGRL